MLYELLTNLIWETPFKVIIRQFQSHVTTQMPIKRELVKLVYDQTMEYYTKAIKKDNVSTYEHQRNSLVSIKVKE